MNKKFFLSAVVFLLAIGGAFASQYLLADVGYSKQIDVQLPDGEQEELCKPRDICDGGPHACTADFEEGTQLYVGVQLWKLSVPNDETTCTIQLFRSNP